MKKEIKEKIEKVSNEIDREHNFGILCSFLAGIVCGILIYQILIG